MLDDVIALLDRKYDALRAREDIRDLVLHLAPFVDALDREPRLRMHLDDMVEEARRRHEDFASEDALSLAALRQLRERITRVPEIDDDAPDGSFEDRCSLAVCDNLLEADPVLFSARLTADTPDVSRAERAAEVMRYRLGAAYPDHDEGARHYIDHGPTVSDLFRDLATIMTAHRFAKRRFSVYVRTSGAFAAARLRAVVRQLNPPTAFDALDAESLEDHLVDLVGSPDMLRALIHDGSTSKQYITEKDVRRSVRNLVSLVYEDLRDRIGTALSLRTMMMRFKVRAEAYDHDALCEIASGVHPRKEDQLANKLAAFLFDQGLSPLTRPMVSGLMPDIIASDLYIEAKQYGERGEARTNIRSGAKQVWDTAHRLRGTPYEVREAYLVVFRRKGPTVIFEAADVRAGGLTLHPILIDVAPNEDSGSRQKEDPVVITATHLLAERTDHDASA